MHETAGKTVRIEGQTDRKRQKTTDLESLPPSRVAETQGQSCKYSLAPVRDGACVLRYDNEAGKGNHRHIGDQQEPCHFTDLDALLRDFRAAIEDFLP